MKKGLPKAVIKTLIYSDIFDFPLRISEIHQYLIGKTCSEQELSNLLYLNNPPNELNQIKINEWQGYFYLGDKKWTIKQRVKREKIAREKLKRAKELTAVLQWIPWIKMVTVTGRVAALNCEEGDDIDLLIVTDKNRLWLSRFFEFLLLKMLRRRRKPGETKDLKDKLCPNMYLSEENLELPNKDLFTANELARVKVIWEKDGAYQEFVKANKWLWQFLSNWWSKQKTQSSKFKAQNYNSKLKSFAPYALVLRFVFCILRFLDSFARFIQIQYMQRRRTTEVIQNNLLMFHPHDMREKVLKKYNQAISSLGKATAKSHFQQII